HARKCKQQFEAVRRNYEAGLPVPKTGENGRPLPRKWTIPTTAKEVEDFIACLKRSESSPHPNIRLFEFLRNLYSEAQRTSREQRNEAQSAILLQYYRPDFVGKKGKNPPASGVDPAPTISPSTSASADSQAVSKPVRPAKHAELMPYIAWLRNEGSTSTTLPFGIQFVEDALRACAARGYRFYMLRSPPSRHVLTPDLYTDYIRDHPLPESGSHGPTIYPGDFANINTTVLAEFFQQDSVTIADIEDAAYWAACWLADATFKDVESDIALTGLRHRILPLLISQGIPAGYNENLHYPDGRIIQFNSGISFNIPGATLVPPTSIHTTSTTAAPFTASNPIPSNTTIDDSQNTTPLAGPPTVSTSIDTEVSDAPLAPESEQK
ncbi:hypothetical protein V5O48_010482, partial [Marasmius crinis-equi]